MGGGHEQVNKERPSNPYADDRFHRLIGIPGILILAVLFIGPVVVVLRQAFIDGAGRFTFAILVQTALDPYVLRLLAFTLVQAALSTVAAIVLALPGAYLLATYDFVGKRLVRALCMIPFVLPSILVVLGFVIIYGNNGMLNSLLMHVFDLQEPPLRILYSFKAIILAHAFYNFPLTLGIVSSYWERLPDSLGQAANTLGARRFTVFRTITLPRLVPAIASSATLVFLFCFSSFAIMLVLGGGPQFTTMEVEIYRQARVMLDTSKAAALSLVSILTAIIFVALHSWAQRALARQEEYRFQTASKGRTPRKISSFSARMAIVVYSIGMLLFVTGPLAGIIVRSFQATESRSGSYAFTLKWYRQLAESFVAVGQSQDGWGVAVLNSLGIALAVTLISIVVSTLTAASIGRRRTSHQVSAEILAMLPMAVSSVIIGLGYYIVATYLHGPDPWRLVAVVLAHVVIASPLVLRAVLPQYRSIPLSYLQASLTLGANVSRTFKQVELPLLRSAIATGAAFAFAISLGELNATLVLSDSHIVTLPVVMYRLIGSYNFPAACALGTVLIVLCVMTFLATESFRRRRHV